MHVVGAWWVLGIVSVPLVVMPVPVHAEPCSRTSADPTPTNMPHSPTAQHPPPSAPSPWRSGAPCSRGCSAAAGLAPEPGGQERGERARGARKRVCVSTCGHHPLRHHPG